MIKIKATGQIIAILKTGEIIAFENRKEYDDWIKTEFDKLEVSSLYGDGTVLYDSIQRGKKMMEHLRSFDYYELEEVGIDTNLID